MPFDPAFDDVYQIGIKEACLSAGVEAERVDEQDFSESILRRIHTQIAKADFLIADMTGRNPNVFYEVGYAHALGKTVILLTQDASDIPFDLAHYPHLVYEGRLTTLRTKLERKLQWAQGELSTVDSFTQADVIAWINDIVLDDGVVVPVAPVAAYGGPELPLHFSIRPRSGMREIKTHVQLRVTTSAGIQASFGLGSLDERIERSGEDNQLVARPAFPFEGSGLDCFLFLSPSSRSWGDELRFPIDLEIIGGRAHLRYRFVVEIVEGQPVLT